MFYCLFFFNFLPLDLLWAPCISIPISAGRRAGKPQAISCARAKAAPWASQSPLQLWALTGQQVLLGNGVHTVRNWAERSKENTEIWTKLGRPGIVLYLSNSFYYNLGKHAFLDPSGVQTSFSQGCCFNFFQTCSLSFLRHSSLCVHSVACCCVVKAQAQCHISWAWIPDPKLPESHLSSLCLHFPNCKMGIIRVPTSQGWGKE